MEFNRYINLLSNRRELIFLTLILLIALILRIRRIDYCIEYLNFWDEVWVKGPAKRIMLTGDLNPHFFMYPSFHIYLMSILFFLAHTIIPEIKDSSLILLGRFASVLFGCGTIYVVYLIAKELFNKNVGLIAALFLTLNYLHKNLSHVIKPDAAGIFWVMLTFLYAVKIMKRGYLKDYIYCGIFMGIAGSTKYYVVLLPAIIAHFIYIYNLTAKDGWFYQAIKDRKMIFLFISFTVFIITSPYIIFDFKTLLLNLNLLYLSGQVSSIYQISSEDWLHWRFIYQLFITYSFIFGIPLFLLSIGGASLLLKKDGSKALLLLSYPVNFFIFACSIANTSYGHEHSTLVPFICILGSIFIKELLINKIKIIRLLGYLSLFLVIGYSVITIITIFDNKGDIHHKTEEWIKNNITQQNKVAYYLDMVGIDQTKFIIVTPPNSFPELTKNILIEKDPDYIIFSHRYLKSYHLVKENIAVDTLKALLSGKLGYELVKTFEGSYFLEGFYSSLAPEYKCDKISILKKKNEIRKLK